MSARVGKRDTKEAIRAAQRDWLREVLRKTGETASQLAKEVGVSDTTLTRFLNKEDYSGTLAPVTIARIAEHAGVNTPGAGAQPAPRGFREDGAPWAGPEAGDGLGGVIAALLRHRPDAHPWVMKSDALALEGVRPGDIMIIDMVETPRAGEVVCAQIEQGLGAVTVFRVYRPPYLVAAAYDPTAYPPEIVDGERVRIAGVMTDMLRGRKA